MALVESGRCRRPAARPQHCCAWTQRAVRRRCASRASCQTANGCSSRSTYAASEAAPRRYGWRPSRRANNTCSSETRLTHGICRPGTSSTTTWRSARRWWRRSMPRVRRSGLPLRLWDPVRLFWTKPGLAVSRNGTLLYFPAEADRVLTWVDRQQRAVPALAAKGYWGPFRLSPDGRRVAIEVGANQAEPEIAVVDLDRGISTRIVPAGRFPLWTPDGTPDRVRVHRSGHDPMAVRRRERHPGDPPQDVHREHRVVVARRPARVHDNRSGDEV